jgi:sulfopyruvate decarboxylase TPP-binding subunit
MTERTYFPQVATVDDTVAKLLYHCDWYSGVPDSVLGPVVEKLPGYMPAARENHAFAAAFGNRLGGGRPCVLIQNSGLGLIGDVIFGTFNLYDMGVLAVVSNRGELAWEEPQHLQWGAMTMYMLAVLDFEIIDFDGVDSIEVAANIAFGLDKPTALVVHRGNLG